MELRSFTSKGSLGQDSLGSSYEGLTMRFSEALKAKCCEFLHLFSSRQDKSERSHPH